MKGGGTGERGREMDGSRRGLEGGREVSLKEKEGRKESSKGIYTGKYISSQY